MGLRRGIGVLSTSADQPNSTSFWKQEVGQRVFAHPNNGGLPAEQPDRSVQSRQEPDSRAAQIAARVAARYAQAPSYSQMQPDAHVARNAVPEALPEPLAAPTEAFPVAFDTEQASLPAQPPKQARKPVFVPAPPAPPPSLEAWESDDFRALREPDFVLSPPDPASAPAPARTRRQAKNLATPEEDGRERPALADGLSDGNEAEPVEPVVSSHANIIEFPREIVAPRKRRPRRAEGPLAADGLGIQLNIFDVDSGALFIEPKADVAAPAWASIELEAQPPEEPAPEPRSVVVSLPALRLAPIRLRMMAALIDSALVAGAFLGAALAAIARIGHPLPMGIAKLSAIFGLLLAGMLYQAIFLALDEATPGMKCAGLSLYTLDNQYPARSQRCARLGALLLSLLPVGLGLTWMLFDDDNLCWHERLSKTYLRTG